MYPITSSAMQLQDPSARLVAREKEDKVLTKQLTEKIDANVLDMRPKMHVEVYSWMVTFLNVYKMNCLRELTVLKGISRAPVELQEITTRMLKGVDDIVAKAQEYNAEFQKNQDEINKKITTSIADLETGSIALLFPDFDK